jgi:methyl-accepting chemotaxis protein
MGSNRGLSIFSFSKKAPAERVDPATDGAHLAPPPAPDITDGQLREVFNLFEQDVTRVVNALSAGMSAARDKTEITGARLEEVDDAVHHLRDASEMVTQEISGIAASTEELTIAANDITSTVTEVQTRTRNTMESATNSAREIEGLGVAVAEIGTLLTAISDIASRTNLLALNATIEAARAGEAGRGFAVVAQEVKALSVAAGQSVSSIRQRMEALKAASDGAITSMKQICGDIAEITPICETISQAADEQRETIADLATRMNKAQSAVAEVTDSVRTIKSNMEEARGISAEAGQLNEAANAEAQNLKRLVVTILRSTPVADRRLHERFPIDLAMRIRTGGEMVPARTFDVSEGGVLIKPSEKFSPVIGTSYEAEITRIGTLRLKVVNTSPMGAHCMFENPSAEVLASIRAAIEAFRVEHQPLIERAQTFSDEIRRSIEDAVETRRLSPSAVFDTDYKAIPGTNPVQYSTKYLAEFDRLLPGILERTLRLDSKMVFCLAIDRNGYIPVHNQRVSQPQRPGDVAWNTANCRNRRIFDDRAGLLAGRITKPYLIQTYSRDMGNGVRVMMKEVDVPLIINGKAWGGIRMAYSL